MGFERLTAYLDSLAERYGVPGADMKITRGHEVVYRHMTGFSDYEKRVPVSENDVYNIYSGSKPITMAGVMQLIERGQLGLDDRLDTYLPEFAHMKYATDFQFGKFPFAWPDENSPLAEATKPMLIHDLMSMTSGMSYNLDAAPVRRVVERSGGEASTREVVAAMAEMPLLSEPGTHYSYALSHDVLAAVVEVITGMRFRDYMKQNVFEPLGITRMYYQVPEEEKPHLAAQYAKSWHTGEIRPDSSMPYRITKNYDSGGAGLVTSVDEYSKFAEAMANGGVGATGERILKPESIDLMRKNWLNETQLADFALTGKLGYGYGLGVRTLIDGSHSKSPVGEFGWDGAAGCYVVIDPVNRIGMFYAQEIMGMMEAYSEIHPTLRDLAYEAMGF